MKGEQINALKHQGNQWRNPWIFHSVFDAEKTLKPYAHLIKQELRVKLADQKTIRKTLMTFMNQTEENPKKVPYHW